MSRRDENVDERERVRRAARWLLTPALLAWVAVIFWGSVIIRPNGIPQPVEGLLAAVGPALAHLGLYALLATLLFLSLEAWYSWRRLTASLVSVVIAVSYGGLMELLQTVVPGRHPSLADAGLNTAGAIAGALAGAVAVRLLYAVRR